MKWREEEGPPLWKPYDLWESSFFNLINTSRDSGDLDTGVFLTTW